MEILVGLNAIEVIESNAFECARCKEVLSKLLKCLEELKESFTKKGTIDNSWTQQWRFADEEFHRWLAVFSRQGTTEKKLADLFTEDGSPFEHTKYMTVEECCEVIEEHRRILIAILDRDKLRTSKAICDHLQKAKQRRYGSMGAGW